MPLTFHFSGTILHGEMQVAMVPWSCSAQFRLPVETWRALMAAYYPGGGWVRLETGTLDALAARKAAGGLPSYDATIAELLRGGEIGPAHLHRANQKKRKASA